MSTSAARAVAAQHVVATGVRFTEAMIYVSLSDGLEIGVPLARFPWLEEATPEQRAAWSIEPHGYAVWWADLDDGIEVDHLLGRGKFGRQARP